MRTVLQDLRYAFRMFAKNPGVTAMAVLSMALAIGPNSALFSILDSVLLRQSPVRDASGIFSVSFYKGERKWVSLTYPEFNELRGAARTAGLIGWVVQGAVLSIGGEQRVMLTQAVTDNYFALLGIQAAPGRTFGAESGEGAAGPPPVVIGYGLWRRAFAADPAIAGKDIVLNSRHFRIAGVAPAGFGGLDFPVELWIPLRGFAALRPGGDALLEQGRKEMKEIVARLRPGMTAEQAQAEFAALGARITAARGAARSVEGALVSSFAERRKSGKVVSVILLGLVSLVLLIACANVAGVLLAQGEARRDEIAIRQAMGATRGRLVRQLIAESALLGLLAAALGLLLAWWLADFVSAFKLPLPVTLNFDFRFDYHVMAYTLSIALLTSALFGLLPALKASRFDIASEIKGDAARARRGARFFSARGALVLGQVAVAQFLLAGALLFARSYTSAQSVRPGFDAKRNTVLMLVAPGFDGRAFQASELVDRLRSIPGVKNASFARTLPLSLVGNGGPGAKVYIPGVTSAEESEAPQIGFNNVAPGYFETIGTRILRGRGFGANDYSERSRSVLVNELMARTYWPGRDPLGQLIRIDGSDYQVAGVTENGKYGTIYEAPQPYMFLPAPARAGSEGWLIVHTEADPEAAIASMRRELQAVAPQILIVSANTMKQHMRVACFLQEAGAGLTGAIGMLGIFLASVGLYGIVSYNVNRRRHEIGVRMAMGAQPKNVMSLVLRQGMGLVAAGIAIGIAAAAAAAKVVAQLLYGISPGDPASYLLGAALVLAIALAATHVPARRAVRLDPIAVLRRE